MYYKGAFASLAVSGSNLQFKLTSGNVAAVAVIMSRRAGSDWLRSNAKFVISEAAMGSDCCSLMDAAATDGTKTLDLENELFLNNAGTGGSQGTASAPANTGGTTDGGTNTGGNTGGDNGGGGGDNGGSDSGDGFTQ